jgi:hypothetical protein
MVVVAVCVVRRCISRGAAGRDCTAGYGAAAPSSGRKPEFRQAGRMTEFRRLDALLESPVSSSEDGTVGGPSYTPAGPVPVSPAAVASVFAESVDPLSGDAHLRAAHAGVPPVVQHWARGGSKPEDAAVEAVIRAGQAPAFDRALARAHLSGLCAAGWLVALWDGERYTYHRPEVDPDLSPKPEPQPRTKMWIPERFARKVRKIKDAETGEVFELVDGSIRLPEQWVDHATGQPVEPPWGPGPI